MGQASGNGGRKEIELWELSGEDDDPRMMRLAEPTGKAAGHRTRQARSAQAVKRRRAKRRKVLLYRIFALFMIVVCLVLIYQTTGAIYRMIHNVKAGRGKGIVEVVSERMEGDRIEPPEILVDYLEVNDYSRPGTKLEKIENIFVHYTANPGTSAQQNRSYFANLAKTRERAASAHFIIGYEGELIQCIPLKEQAYAVATRNGDSVSIECCYLDEDGKFTQETYDTLVHTLAWLCQEYRLSTDDILRHYDCGGKLCPLYYVEHEDAWEKLLTDVKSYEDSSQS
ncbi:MAG: N-acetylmuramoyl-L-alanine amidase [Bacteroidales bacterium]|nr:N-acetylmuramoyl-L-alanine amidase [Bacteroidales bacterium]MCM1414687.1 N-acetylmuramoyl-L-alanine amidase [bacterium]MCM1422496.1 N-acetylmuramoyl-L-alanine amidase [bacterium]